ncbi:MAG TPA: hypothetical protein VNI77_12310 [Nitrososphaera sp.]|nr:hypothetical protein [Nitrososphaera sp.]
MSVRNGDTGYNLTPEDVQSSSLLAAVEHTGEMVNGASQSITKAAGPDYVQGMV